MANGLNLFTGNRLEILAQALAKVMEAPVGNPLTPDTVVLQSQGMARWLSLALARENGICANVRWRFPNAFVQDIFEKTLPDVKEARRFDAKVAAWSILAELDHLEKERAFSELSAYLGDGAEPLKRYQIAELLADTLDQYLTYRPEMIEAWEKGESEDFQAILYRRLQTKLELRHRVHLMNEFKLRLESIDIENNIFPERVFIFGVSSLPEFHLELFTALANHCQVNLFLLNPCPQFWGEILSDAESRRLSNESGADNLADDDLMLELGNPLLASMGGQGREFFDMVAERGLNDFPLFYEPDESTVLGAIQADIYHLRDRSRGEADLLSISSEDVSFTVHSCHSPTREVEVLRDWVLSLIERDETLSFSDFVVMAPDISLYAPVIEAVFGRPLDSGGRIPFSIADQAGGATNRAVEATLLLLDLAGFRFEASGVMQILDNQRIRSRFGIRQGDLEVIENWIAQTAIRWGEDASRRQKEGFAGSAENTWKKGLDRLFAGYAMGETDALWQGLLPEAVEGDPAALLGRVARFMKQLTVYVKGLDRPKTAQGWVDFFEPVLDTFLVDTSIEDGVQSVRNALYRMADAARGAENQSTVPFEVVRFILKTALNEPDPVSGFITGGITFCSMLPMRSIPFKVVGLLGMGHGAFPRQHRAPAFDLMALSPKRGDRSRRKDDRYLFLEILLSVRETLWVSYTGQSIRDNSPLQPSVLLSELLDYVEASSEGEKATEKIVVRHPLHPFSREYFSHEKGPLFTYDVKSRRVAQGLLKESKAPSPFFPDTLKNNSDCMQLTTAALIECLSHPLKYRMVKGLGMTLATSSALLEDEEPFAVGGLARFQMGDYLFESVLKETPMERAAEVVRGMGTLPAGEVGNQHLDAICLQVQSIAEGLKPWVNKEPQRVTGELLVGKDTLSYDVGPVFGDTLVLGRFGRIRPRDLVAAWVQLLVLGIKGDAAGSAVVAGGTSSTERDLVHLAMPPNPLDTLQSLLELYRQANQNYLPLFPRASFAWCEEIRKKGDADKATAKARGAFYTSPYGGMGDEGDPHVRLGVEGRNPFGQEELPGFIQASERLYLPILEAVIPC